MSSHPISKAEPRNFSLAFEQMCFAAIASTSSPLDTLQQLILHCFVILPDEQFETDEQFAESLAVLFGIDFPPSQIQDALEALSVQKSITRPLGTNYTLDPNIRTALEDRIEQARALEERVQIQWFSELKEQYPGLDQNTAWKVLRSYAAKAFREHGIQAAALFDPSVAKSEEHRDSLANILNATLQDEFESDDEARNRTQNAITDFFASIGSSLDRATYVAQLADGAFNYFSLAVDPRSAQRFRENLSPLTVFLDTNFLFSILGLNTDPMNEVANELVRIIQENDFPFSLCYHEKTAQELQNTIAYYGDRLRGKRWPQHLSRAASKSAYLSGIELRYHQRNAQNAISAESFLKPLEHADVMLEQKGICLVKHEANRDLSERANLLEEYRQYLEDRNNPKHINTVQHDTIVLNFVYQQRLEALSSLDTGTILLTHDYYLYGFDKERNKSNGHSAAVVLPNQLLQVLRPFVPSSVNFDVSFAETFAIPEFRTAGSGASDAASKLLNIIAGYQGFPEETAEKLLSNDILIERLRDVIKDDAKFTEQVDLAIAQENQALIEEKAALSQKLNEKEIEKSNTEQAKLESDSEAARYRQQAEEATAQAEKEKAEKEKAEKRASDAERKADQQARNFALVISFLSTVAFFVAVYGLKWEWLLDHPNTYSLQALAGAAVFLAILGFWYPKWRNRAWGTGGLPAAIFALLGLLGGKG